MQDNLTVSDAKLVAQLPDHPGFVLLLGQLAQEERKRLKLLKDIAHNTDAELAGATREWLVFRDTHAFIKNLPKSIREELDSQGEESYV